MHLERVGAEREREGIGGEIEPCGHGGVAEERNLGDDVQPVGLHGLGDRELQTAGEECDACDGDARFRGGEFELQGGLVKCGELGGDGDELAGDGGVVADEKFGDRQGVGPGGVAWREVNGAVGDE